MVQICALLENVKKIKIADYNYPLPEEKIAKKGLHKRDSSKLLVCDPHSFSDSYYSSLADHLSAGDVLVFNNTKVVQARLFFPKNQNTTIEVFCLEPIKLDIQQAMGALKTVEFKCLIGGARKWKQNPLRIQTEDGLILEAYKEENIEGSFRVRFKWNTSACFSEILEELGKVPLPPYMNRDATEDDRSRYQTVYAEYDGSVAAPTAGLHFTPELLTQLEEKQIKLQKLTLHVGAGTFKPVSSDEIGDHFMHAEEFLINKETISTLSKAHSNRIIPVGTTSLRAIESTYWLGVLLLEGEKFEDELNVQIPQWLPYGRTTSYSKQEALGAVINYLEKKDISQLKAKTEIIIAPSYEHKLIDGLITNFHQPKSTLLLLIASILGDRWKDMYQYALNNDYRFLSFGDGCLILR